MTASRVPVVRATGRPFDVGYAHGAALAGPLRAFIDDDLCRINRLAPAPVSVDSLRRMLDSYGSAIAAATPGLSEEIDGLARGAGISRDLAVLLQIRREIIGYQRIPARGDCTTYASLSAGPAGSPVVGPAGSPVAGPVGRAGVPVVGLAGAPVVGPAGSPTGIGLAGAQVAGPAGGQVADPAGGQVVGPAGGPVLAQTVDLNGDLDDQIAVLDIGLTGPGQSAPARRALVLSFGGLLGYLGVNSDGLAIGLNLVLGGRWRPGVPPYLAIRHLLDSAASVQQALSILRELPLASSRSLMLCDSDTVACVEICDNQVLVLNMARPVHTNHFLHPEFTGADELNIFARNSSLLRLKACEAGLAALSDASGVAEHFALLAQPTICVAGNGDIRRERTVAAVVLLPGRRELHLRPGDPSVSSTQSFTFTDTGAAASATGGPVTGGRATGGSATGGRATGGRATGGRATGGRATGRAGGTS